LRFRSGCSGCPIDTGRHRRISLAQRLCVKYFLHSVCDEYHVIFECPALVPLRAQSFCFICFHPALDGPIHVARGYPYRSGVCGPLPSVYEFRRVVLLSYPMHAGLSGVHSGPAHRGQYAYQTWARTPLAWKPRGPHKVLLMHSCPGGAAAP